MKDISGKISGVYVFGKGTLILDCINCEVILEFFS
jgi:hypothetical protein